MDRQISSPRGARCLVAPLWLWRTESWVLRHLPPISPWLEAQVKLHLHPCQSLPFPRARCWPPGCTRWQDFWTKASEADLGFSHWQSTPLP